jgi:hypothetical protein
MFCSIQAHHREQLRLEAEVQKRRLVIEGQVMQHTLLFPSAFLAKALQSEE